MQPGLSDNDILMTVQNQDALTTVIHQDALMNWLLHDPYTTNALMFSKARKPDSE